MIIEYLKKIIQFLQHQYILSENLNDIIIVIVDIDNNCNNNCNVI